MAFVSRFLMYSSIFLPRALLGPTKMLFCQRARPPREPSKILIGCRVMRGPISMRTSFSISSYSVNFSSCWLSIWYARNQILLSWSLNESTWSMKGFDLGWFFGVVNIWHSSSFIKRRLTYLSNPLSKESRGRLNFRQLPLSLSSSVVQIFWIRNLAEGPDGLLQSHMYRSLCLRCSKNMTLLHERSKAISSTTETASLRLTFDSRFVFGTMSQISLTMCCMRPVSPLELTTRVRYLFFHSLELGSGSLNTLNSSSESTCSSAS